MTGFPAPVVAAPIVAVDIAVFTVLARALHVLLVELRHVFPELRRLLNEMASCFEAVAARRDAADPS